MKIDGCQEFVDRTKEALSILQELDPFNYRRVEKYISEISETAYGSYINGKDRIFYVGIRTAFPEQVGIHQDPVKWYASSIVHDAVHSELVNRFDVPHRSVPYYDWNKELKKRHEEIALKAQGRCMKKLGLMNDTDITHYIQDSLNSEYWNIPRKSRDW